MCVAGMESVAVEVAADALWRIANNWTPKRNTYVEPTGKFTIGSRASTLRRLQGGSCNVCAKGALLLAAIEIKAAEGTKLVDGLRCETSLGDICIDGLRDVFKEEELDFIERAFERWDAPFGTIDPAMHRDFAKEATPRRSLCAILRNIIANNGRFLPRTGIHKEIGVVMQRGKIVVTRRFSRRGK